MVETWRFDNNLTSAALNDSLDYGEAQADTLTVHLCSPLQLTKPVEKFWQILSCNPLPSVFHIDHESLLLLVVARLDLDFSFPCEFHGVFDKVDQDLLDSSFIAIKKEWELPFNLIFYQNLIASLPFPLLWPYKE